MKLCAVVVTYYPDVKSATENILQYLPYVDHLIIWENTPMADKEAHEIIIPEYSEKITYLGTGKNEGISVALNAAAGFALKNGYTHLMTMDQDSYWNNFSDYKQEITNKDDESIYGPRVNECVDSSQDLLYIITSGMVVPVSVYKKIGGYCTDFKIDGIDIEFCFRARSSGVKVKRVSHGKLIQTFGSPKQRNYRGRKITLLNYSSIRVRGIMNSHLRILRKYDCPKTFVRGSLENLLLRCPAKIMLYEGNRFSKLKAYFQGLIEGVFTSTKFSFPKFH